MKKLFNQTLRALVKYLPPPVAYERALNLCLVQAGIRPACLWYMDFDVEKSTAYLDTVDTEELGYGIIMGNIPVPPGTDLEEKEILLPHVLVFRLDNQAAQRLIKDTKPEEDVFQHHKQVGEALGYVCAGNPPSSPYHVRLVGTAVAKHQHFTIMEQMCRAKHTEAFRKFMQDVQDFCDEHELGIMLDLFIATRKS